MNVVKFDIQFAGGFAAKEICLQKSSTSDSGETKLETISTFYPQDNNSVQTFSILSVLTDNLKMIFPESTDTYGRIVVYKLQIHQNC